MDDPTVHEDALDNLRRHVRVALADRIFRLAPQFDDDPVALRGSDVDALASRLICGTERAFAFDTAVKDAMGIARGPLRQPVAWVREFLNWPTRPFKSSFEFAAEKAAEYGEPGLEGALLRCAHSHPGGGRLWDVRAELASRVLATFGVCGAWPLHMINDLDEGDHPATFRAARGLSNLAYILSEPTCPSDNRQTIRWRVGFYAAQRNLDGRDRDEVRNLAERFLANPTLYNLLKVVGLVE